MAIPKLSTQGDTVRPLQASRPDPLELQIPQWLREKYPDYAKAFDRVQEHNAKLMDYFIQLEDRLTDLEA